MDFTSVMSRSGTGVVECCRKDAEAASNEKASAETPPPEIRSLMERQPDEILRNRGWPPSPPAGVWRPLQIFEHFGAQTAQFASNSPSVALICAARNTMRSMRNNSLL